MDNAKSQGKSQRTGVVGDNLQHIWVPYDGTVVLAVTALLRIKAPATVLGQFLVGLAEASKLPTSTDAFGALKNAIGARDFSQGLGDVARQSNPSFQKPWDYLIEGGDNRYPLLTLTENSVHMECTPAGLLVDVSSSS